jgi:hypothetical protein
MTDDSITPERADELLRFLPGFSVPGRSYTKTWAGGERTADGAITVPYPVYEDDVLAFFGLAGQPWWSDYAYDPRQAHEMLHDDECIARCSLEELRTMLTYCVRGERFCDGHWEHLLGTGRIVALLRRLAVLREELAQ